MPTSYDLVPYESNPFPQTHPDRLAVIGTLLGMRPAPAIKCRVLEIGSAAGGNLIPLALAYPESSFLGIDLSQVQISEGQEMIRGLGLGNIELKLMSVIEFPSTAGRGSPAHAATEGLPAPTGDLRSGASAGSGDPRRAREDQKVDYIICHGVYSWVPTAVQQKILEICKSHLAPQGIAYISYNTYPGWHMRGMIRDMLQYHAEQFTTPAQKVKQARNLLDFLAKASHSDQGPYGLLLRHELESFRRSSDSYLFHEHLEEVNEPIYFHQFVEKAAAHGLRYLGEADLRVMVPGNFPPEIENVLQMVAQDAVHLEQYMDFLRNRMFRQTLLCHQNVEPNYALKWEAIRRFQIASPAKPLTPGPSPQASEGSTGTSEVLNNQEPMQFETPDGITLQARDPIVKAAMVELGEAWPRAMSFEELMVKATARLQTAEVSKSSEASAAKGAETLGRSLLQFYSQASTSLVEFWLHQPKFITAVSERPMASPLARRQADTKNRVTTLRHETAHLGDFERQLLRLLDGTRDRPALLNAVIDLVQEGELTVEKDGQAVNASEPLREVVGQALDGQLAALARHGLLVE